MFEVKVKDGLARIGRLRTAHGDVETPALLPVINPNKMIITPKKMQELFGTQILITNSYIIFRSDELRKRALREGVHKLIDFDGAIMTDSGAFQSHVYGDVEVDPMEIIDFQRAIGVDIGTMLDAFGEPYEDYDTANAKVKETIKRAKASVERRGDMYLAAPIQGGVHLKLRTKCARKMGELDSQVHPIGGIVPLMENYRFSELVDIVMTSKESLPHGRPVHLFGAGHPILFGLGVLMGADMFDSSSYIKYAMDGRIMLPEGTKHLNELQELGCPCPVCTNYSINELKDAMDGPRMLALHNLYVSYSELAKVKTAIRDGQLWEYVEMRARCHPEMLEALKKLKSYRIFMEKFEPLSRRHAFRFTGIESLNRPGVLRYRQRLLDRYVPEKELVGHRHLFGFMPAELDQMYPLEQCLWPESLDSYSKASIERELKRIEKALGMKFKQAEGPPSDLDRARAVARYQFGIEAEKVLFKGKIEIITSKSTGRIRNIVKGKKHILSMRAHDGLYTLKPEGAKLLHKAISTPGLRVIVNEDSAEFNIQGKNVFCQFVVDMDEELRPGDEVLVVTEEDELVAIGKMVMHKDEVLSFKSGVAVKVRDGMGS